MSVSAYAALEPKVVVPWNFEPRALADDEVEIKVTHCGLCHTDVSQIDNDWGFSHYPMVRDEKNYYWNLNENSFHHHQRLQVTKS